MPVAGRTLAERTGPVRVMPVIRVQKKGKITIPTAVRKRGGIADGDLLEVKLHRGSVVLTPRQDSAPPILPSADDEYTPAQRRIVDARLAEGIADIKAGRTHGPFSTHAEMMSFLNKDTQPSDKKR